MTAPWIAQRCDEVVSSLPIERLPSAIIIDALPGWGASYFVTLWLQRIMDDPSCNPRETPYTDILWVQPKEQDRDTTSSKRRLKLSDFTLTVDQIRDAIQFMERTRQASSRRIAVLEAVETMSIAASHALLKSLEEPLDGGHWILITTSIDQLLPTIRSRCTSVPLRQAPHSTVHKWLIEQGVPKNELEHLMYEHGDAPYKILESQDLERKPLRELLLDIWKTRSLDLSVVEPLLQQDFDDLLIRWMRITERLYQNRRSSRASKFWDELIATRRAYHDASSINKQLHLERLLILWSRIR